MIPPIRKAMPTKRRAFNMSDMLIDVIHESRKPMPKTYHANVGKYRVAGMHLFGIKTMWFTILFRKDRSTSIYYVIGNQFYEHDKLTALVGKHGGTEHDTLMAFAYGAAITDALYAQGTSADIAVQKAVLKARAEVPPAEREAILKAIAEWEAKPKSKKKPKQ